MTMPIVGMKPRLPNRIVEFEHFSATSVLNITIVCLLHNAKTLSKILLSAKP